MTRKHRGIIQEGGNKGKLRKGFFYSGERSKSGLAIIKEKKYIQNGGTGNTLRNLVKTGKFITAAGLGTSTLFRGEASSVGSKVGSKVGTQALPTLFPQPTSRLLKSNMSNLPSKQLIKPPIPIIKSQLNKQIPSVSSVIPKINIYRTKNLFNNISSYIEQKKANLKTESNQEKTILDNFIKELIDSFLDPMKEGDLISQLDKFEPIIILRIVLKITRGLIENKAQTSTEQEINKIFNKLMTESLSEEKKNLPDGPINKPRAIHSNITFNQILLFEKNNELLKQMSIINNIEKNKILGLLNEYNFIVENLPSRKMAIT